MKNSDYRLENAVDACLRVAVDNRFIHLSSQIRHNKLYITMENSFDGEFRHEGKVYFFSKREGTGIGLSSIVVTRGKCHGTAVFDTNGSVFQLSVMVETDTAHESAMCSLITNSLDAD